MILHLTTCQAANTHAVTAAVADILAQQLNLETKFVIDPPWEECLQGLLTGQIQVGWMCGYPYVMATAVTSISLSTSPNPDIELLALPVIAGARYQNRPIYFSDVVVRRDSPVTTFTDLRGATWAYNEVGSQSGYHITRYKLAQLGENGDFFGKVVASGAHMRSLEMVVDGKVDASAIDSTVLEDALRHSPALAQQIRLIDTLGPSPIPPWVIHKSVPAPLRRAIRQALTQLHQTSAGRAVLALGEMVRFETAVDAHYNSLRRMLTAAQNIHL